uniref:Uncharacterized protein n=1 Tax=Romanomermis culicivorax TaxID=13658 RepID=A0A915L0H8_ROMCU
MALDILKNVENADFHPKCMTTCECVFDLHPFKQVHLHTRVVAQTLQSTLASEALLSTTMVVALLHITCAGLSALTNPLVNTEPLSTLKQPVFNEIVLVTWTSSGHLSLGDLIVLVLTVLGMTMHSLNIQVQFNNQ